MTDMITRCPVCETSFRITESQLKTARGAVRCGSCLQIFKAADHLVQRRPGSTDTTAKAAAPARGQAPTKSPSSRFAVDLRGDTGEIPTAQPDQGSTPERWRVDDLETGEQASTDSRFQFDQTAIDAQDDVAPSDSEDDLLISDDMPLADEGRPRASAFGDDELFIDLDSWNPQEKSLFDRKAKSRDDEDDEEKEQADESWALELLEEDDDEPVSQPRRAAAPPAQESFRDFDVPAGSDGRPAPRPASERKPVPESKPESEPEPFSASRDDDTDDLWLDDRSIIAEDDYDHDTGDRSELLKRIEPAPVEFAIYHGPNWRKTLLWGGLSILGLLLLIAQVAWLQFDRLSREQPYRDLYAAVCPHVGCQLPSLAEPDKIRTSNLVVRSHPQAEGALMVDTILLNTASHAQPFPDLILSFSNIHGETLAARRFTPREYLAGELAGRTEMPSNQPVHLTLEIADPGPEAVNYSAYIPGAR